MEDQATVTKKFLNQFSPTNKTHVEWLKSIHVEVQSMDTNKSSRVPSLIMNNPMNVSVTQNDLLEWIHIQFVLSMKYCGAVFDKTACIL